MLDFVVPCATSADWKRCYEGRAHFIFGQLGGGRRRGEDVKEGKNGG